LDIQDGSALLITQSALEGMPYHNTNEVVTWEQSDIRAYLNGEFYERFTEDEKARVAAAPGGEDLVFLLSLEEVLLYFGDSGQPDGGIIDDEYNGARVVHDLDGLTATWWLRSSGQSGESAACVAQDGRIIVQGYSVNTDTCHPRPALWLDIDGITQ
jgi:hypothetical protein